MTETKNIKKPKSNSKKAEKILEKSIHPIVLFYGISFTLLLLYYSFIQHKVPLFLTVCILAISSFLTYYNYYGRRIVVTKYKIYVYRLGKKTISLSFSKDFLHIKFEKTKLGKFLDYGSILIVTQDEKYYKVHFVNEPEEIFYTTIEQYENVMIMLNPEYSRKFIKDGKNLEGRENIIVKEEFEKIDD